MKVLLLDIETAPNKAYVWGLFKQNVAINQIVEPGYTLSWAAKWLGKKQIMFDSVYHSSMEHMVEGMYELLNEADAVVHYNGKKFDIPTLNREFILLNKMPPDSYHQIDLLPVVRREFKFPSNKLDYVAQALGLGAKIEHKGMSLWKDCMEGDAKAWKHMKRYNIQDVKLLEDLYFKLLPWIKSHPNHGLYTDNDRPVCTNCGSEHVLKVGVETTKTQKYQRYRCSDCSTPLRGRKTILSPEQSRVILTQSKL